MSDYRHFSPLPMSSENVQRGRLYIWAHDGDFGVVRLNEDGDGLEDMSDDFGGRDNWYFEDNLIGCLYGPVLLSENDGFSEAAEETFMSKRDEQNREWYVKPIRSSSLQ